MPNHAPTVHLSYVDMSGVVKVWSELCLQLIVYEHEADETVSQTHCHLLMVGCSVDREALKRRLYKELPQETRKGNEMWAWTHKEWERENPGKEYDFGMIKYMSKGKLAPKYNKNISDNIVEEQKAKWVDHGASGIDQPSKDYNEYRELKKQAILDWKGNTFTLDTIRTWTMSWYWHRDGRLPHAGNYKRNAASIYLHLIETFGSESNHDFGCAMREIKNLWY